MNKKVDVSANKEFKIKIDKETTIGNTKFKKDQELTLEIKEKKDLELPKEDKGEVTIIATVKGLKEGSDDVQNESDKELKVVYERGYFRNGLVFRKLGDQDLKESKQLMSTGGDYFFNLVGWGIITIILVIIGAVGYYWWSSSQQEEEEESV
jgi:hypothetical protein